MEGTRSSAAASHRRSRRRVTASLFLCCLVWAGLTNAIDPLQAQGTSALRIRQIYAGGEVAAPYNADFIELFNAGPDPIALDGWTLQAAGGDGGSWSLLALDGFSMPAGGALLVGLRADGGGQPLPAPDLTWTIDLDLASGAVRVVDGSVDGGGAADSVAYGDASGGEGAAIPALTFTVAALRLEGGCRDGNHNQSDFALAAPEPHNSASPPTPCAPPSPTELPTQSPTITPTSAPSPTATSTPSQTPTSTETPSPSPIPTLPSDDGLIWLSELFPAPSNPQIGVGDWLELYNPGPSALNLCNWGLRVASGATVEVTADLWVAAGAYVVFAQRVWPEEQSGVPVTYADSALVMGADDQVQVVAPGGRVVDAFAWGEAPSIVVGRSLERTVFAMEAEWQVAWEPWPHGGGEYGSPGAPWQPPPAPTRSPIVRISEYMADSEAVADEMGEWVELQNPNAFPVEMAGWSLGDSSGEKAPLDGLILAAQSYAVLGRSADGSTNGGVSVQALLGGVHLANASDDLMLIAADGMVIDWAAWGESSPVTPGRSQERLAEGTSRDQIWRMAVAAWPGSAGDWGSPGGPPPYAPPEPTPAPTPSPTATLPTLPPLPAAWEAVLTPPPLQIDEVAYRGDDQEYVVLVNRSDAPVSLAGWLLGDAEKPTDSEGLYFLPPQASIPARGAFVVARSGEAFRQRWFVPPDAQIEATNAVAPVLLSHPSLGGEFSLNDRGDTVLLLAPDLRVADAMAFGDHAGAQIGVEGTLSTADSQSLQRAGDFPWPLVRDVRQRFVVAAQNPLLPLTLPAAASRPLVSLSGGHLAQWGVLGGPTTFAPSESLSPFAALSVAAARGLDFAALADPQPLPGLPGVAPATLLPAWSWNGGEDRAVVVGPFMPGLADRWALLPWLQTSGAAALWQGRGQPPSADFSAAFSGSWPPVGGSQQDVALRMLELWRTTGEPMLPALEGRLALDTEEQPLPVTGLVADSDQPAALLDALRARRGWLTTTPGLWLALAVQTATETVWMGSEIAPANALAVTIFAGDRTGRALTVTLWQDDEVVSAWQSAGNSPRQETLLARPGAFLFVTASSADGAYAVSAPLHIAPNPNPVVLINEVLADPVGDLDGDGLGGEADEYIELYNPGDLPVALAEWQLFDLHSARAGGHRYTFDARATMPGRGVRVVWRKDSGIALNNAAERVYLRLPGGGQADEVGWDEWLEPGRSLAQVGGGWQQGQPPTPGQLNDGGSNEATRAAESTVTFAAAMEALPAIASSDAPAAVEEVDDSAQADSVQADSMQADSAQADSAERPALNLALGSAVETIAPGPSIAYTRRIGLEETNWLQGVVVVPPGLVNGSLYLADVGSDGVTAGPGVRVYLRFGDFPRLNEGDQISVTGVVHSFRGEKEFVTTAPESVVLLQTGAPLRPLAVRASAVAEPMESRLVTFEGLVTTTDGDSLFVVDPEHPEMASVRVVVLRSLGWPRPDAQPGERWQVTGVIGQMARAAPWNGGYRVIVRYPADLVRLP